MHKQISEFLQLLTNLYQIHFESVIHFCHRAVVVLFLFLMLCQDLTFSYIRASKCVLQRINQHNSGFGSTSTTTLNLKLYVIYAYICGFNGNTFPHRTQMEEKFLSFYWTEIFKILVMSVEYVLLRLNETNNQYTND